MKPASITIKELTDALRAEFPQMFGRDGQYVIEALRRGRTRVRRKYHKTSLRPGGTLSGATMMELADVAMYVALLGSIGWKPLAVTTNLNINFLRKPGPCDLLADAKLIKLGKRLAVGDITVRSEGQDEPVAHATATYSIPRHD